MLDNPRRSLCTKSELSHFEGVESDKEGSSLASAPESYEHKNFKFGGTIGWASNPATWPGVMNWNARCVLIQIGLCTITTEFSSETRVIGQF